MIKCALQYSRTDRQIVQLEMTHILNLFLRSDMYHVTFHFQEIVPIIGYCDIRLFALMSFTFCKNNKIKSCCCCRQLYKRDTQNKIGIQHYI